MSRSKLILEKLILLNEVELDERKDPPLGKRKILHAMSQVDDYTKQKHLNPITGSYFLNGSSVYPNFQSFLKALREVPEFRIKVLNLTPGNNNDTYILSPVPGFVRMDYVKMSDTDPIVNTLMSYHNSNRTSLAVPKENEEEYFELIKDKKVVHIYEKTDSMKVSFRSGKVTTFYPTSKKEPPNKRDYSYLGVKRATNNKPPK